MATETRCDGCGRVSDGSWRPLEVRDVSGMNVAFVCSWRCVEFVARRKADREVADRIDVLNEHNHPPATIHRATVNPGDYGAQRVARSPEPF